MAKSFSSLSLILVLLAVGFSGCKDQEAAESAVEALQAVDSAVSVGTNMVNYRQALVLARTEVDQYLAKDSDSEFAQNLSRAMDGHQAAADWWQCEVARAQNSLESRWDAQARCRDAVLPSIFVLYPDAQPKVEAAVANRQSPVEYQSQALDPDAMLQFVWRHTSADMDKVIEAL